MRNTTVKPVHQMTDHEKYFGSESTRSGEELRTWKESYTRVVNLVDRLSPRWRERSIYVGDALHQEIQDVFSRVKHAEKDAAVLKARNTVAQLEADLAAARKALEKAELA